VPKDDDLELQFAICAWMTGPDHAAEHRVEEGEQHDRRCYIGAGKGDASEKTYPSRHLEHVGSLCLLASHARGLISFQSVPLAPPLHPVLECRFRRKAQLTRKVK
jgi:hypothetical protein